MVGMGKVRMVLLTALLATLLVAASASAQIVLRVATWDGPEGQIPIREVAAEFEAENPGVQVQIEQVDDYKARVIVQVAGGVGPDVFMVGDWDYAEFAASNVSANLTPYLERDGVDLSAYIPTLLENHRYVDGQIYSLPKDFSTLGVYYNMDLFDQAGVPYPEAGWTWDDAWEIARRLTRVGADGEAQSWGISVNHYWNAVAWSYAWGDGSLVMSPEYDSVRGYLDSPGTLDAIRTFYERIRDSYGINVPRAVQDSGGGESGPFISGQAAMLVWGNWAIGQLLRDQPFRFGTVTPPTRGVNSTTFVMEAGWALNPNIEDPERRELAWKLVKKLGTESGQYYMSRNFWAMPSIPSVAAEIGMTTDPHYGPFFAAAYESMPTYWTKVPLFGQVFDSHYGQIRDDFLWRDVDLQVAVSQRIDAIEKALAEGSGE